MAGRNGFGNTRKLPSGRWQAGYLGPDLVRHTGATIGKEAGSGAPHRDRNPSGSRVGSSQWA